MGKIKLFYLLLSLCALCTVEQCKPPAETWYVSAASGLKLRSQPSTTAEAITVIPYREKVMVTEKQRTMDKIDGKEGAWYKVEAQSKQGWLFSGYLSKEEPKALANVVGDWSEAACRGERAKGSQGQLMYYTFEADGRFSAGMINVALNGTYIATPNGAIASGQAFAAGPLHPFRDEFVFQNGRLCLIHQNGSTCLCREP